MVDFGWVVGWGRVVGGCYGGDVGRPSCCLNFTIVVRANYEPRIMKYFGDADDMEPRIHTNIDCALHL